MYVHELLMKLQGVNPLTEVIVREAGDDSTFRSALRAYLDEDDRLVISMSRIEHSALR